MLRFAIGIVMLTSTIVVYTGARPLLLFWVFIYTHTFLHSKISSLSNSVYRSGSRPTGRYEPDPATSRLA